MQVLDSKNELLRLAKNKQENEQEEVQDEGSIGERKESYDTGEDDDIDEKVMIFQKAIINPSDQISKAHLR
eukprot:CAMPEP_0170560922 /NCGR_PEP_ID=MMETSP0211-20121228/51756_1 /TAXON_ID=311385 /ORGANISM="Pseudokeronopsis sp., Strain OXSARD2" /LENGTH=70 /DNA_ID=CAMNT_0010875779 /DNA_START=191 /DNA_END=403 /DNA_ORIENTATION=-